MNFIIQFAGDAELIRRWDVLDDNKEYADGSQGRLEVDERELTRAATRMHSRLRVRGAGTSLGKLPNTSTTYTNLRTQGHHGQHAIYTSLYDRLAGARSSP